MKQLALHLAPTPAECTNHSERRQKISSNFDTSGPSYRFEQKTTLLNLKHDVPHCLFRDCRCDQIGGRQRPFSTQHGDQNPGFLLFYWLCLQDSLRQCIDFSVLRAHFLTTLRSHLDVTCSCYFKSNLFNVDIKYSYIYIYLVYHSCSLKSIEKNLVNYSYFDSC